MKNKKFVFISILALGILCITCIVLFIDRVRSENEGFGSCPAIPKWFSKTDLIGTWVAREFGRSKTSDTLIIREDGTYKQTIHLDKQPPVDYESPWQTWRLDYSKTGLPYIYLQNYRVCAASSLYDCNWTGDGRFRPDCCNDSPPDPHPDEIALWVVGDPEFTTPSRTRAGNLRLALNLGCENSGWDFRLQQP